MNRIGFPLLISTGLVLGMFFAPQARPVQVRVEPNARGEARYAPVAPRQELRQELRQDADVVAQVLEGFLVDALGTERDVLTRVSLTRTEAARELPWRLRAELERSRKLLGWAVRVPVETDENAWIEAPLGARWRDGAGRVVQLSTFFPDLSDSADVAHVAERYGQALDALRQAVEPARSRATGDTEEPDQTTGQVSVGGWIAASSRIPPSSEVGPLSAIHRTWTDRDGIEHRIALVVSAADGADSHPTANLELLFEELLARYPER